MYKIVGGDQREYGPVTSDQVREWIATGRANGQTLATFEGSPWKPLSTFPEFADALRTAMPPTLPPQAPGYGGVGQAYPGVRNNTLAIAGLVLCLLGCCMPFAVLGLVLSVIGLVQINKDPQTYSTSKAIPIVGIVAAVFWLIVWVLYVRSEAFEQIMNMQR